MLRTGFRGLLPVWKDLSTGNVLVPEIIPKGESSSVVKPLAALGGMVTMTGSAFRPMVSEMVHDLDCCCDGLQPCLIHGSMEGEGCKAYM
jgi:hypothetical protein